MTSNHVTFNDKPEIDSKDDISEIHREIEDFDYCIEIHFRGPFCEYNDRGPNEFTIEEQNEYDRCQQIFEDFAVENEILLNVHGFFLETACDWRDEQTLWYRFNLLPAGGENMIADAICSRWANGDFNTFREAMDFDEATKATAERLISQHGDTIEEFSQSQEFSDAVAEAYDIWLRAKKGVQYDGYTEG